VVDFAQELWQFSHMTYSFVLRVSIAAALVAYGMITGFVMHDHHAGSRPRSSPGDRATGGTVRLAARNPGNHE
jgi:hypothetical protein